MCLEPIVNTRNGCIAGIARVDHGYLHLDKPGEDGKGSVNVKGERVCVFYSEPIFLQKQS